LTTVSGQNVMYGVFKNCTNLPSSITFSNLEIIGADNSNIDMCQFREAFNDTNVTSLTFTNLEKIYCTANVSAGGTFYNNTTIQKMYFPKLDTITYGTGAASNIQVACKYIFYSCTSLTELHFGAANQSAIEASAGYSTAWGRGAGNVTIYFDL